ncbi:MAG TPA: putative porin, partial [Gemmatimonadales bacterium]
TAGKFANPVEKPAAGFRSELVWDEDFAPEGLSETITLRKASKGLLRRLAVHLQQWYLQEYSKASDTWMLGGQALLDLKPSETTSLNLAGGYYGYANVGPLAQVANSNDQVNISNSVVLKDGTVLEGGKLIKPDPANPFDRFASGFGQLHGSAALRVDRIAGEAGLQVYGEVVHNLEADDLATGYQFGLGLDRMRKLPGWSVAAVWVHIEQEAALSMYSYSDLGRGGTNQEGIIAAVQYRPTRNVTFALREHIVSPIRTVTPDTPVNRLQADVSFAF